MMDAEPLQAKIEPLGPEVVALLSREGRSDERRRVDVARSDAITRTILLSASRI